MKKLSFTLVTCILLFSVQVSAQFAAGFYGNASAGNLTLTAPNTFFADDVRARVTSASGTSVTISTIFGQYDGTFANGDLVMVVQMQGGTIGDYAIGRIQSVASAPNITLMAPLGKSFSTAGASRVQMIRLYEFDNVTLAGGVIKCHPYNGYIGGILCFLVADQLHFDAATLSIDASTTGFFSGLGGDGAAGKVASLDPGSPTTLVSGANGANADGTTYANYGPFGGHTLCDGDMYTPHNGGIGGLGSRAEASTASNSPGTSGTSYGNAVFKSKFILGNGGDGADGGPDGGEAGGPGGAGGFGLSTKYDPGVNDGKSGTNGGNAGDGGNGGNGAGIVYVRANLITINSTNISNGFTLIAANGQNAQDGEDGGLGGNGGNGGEGVEGGVLGNNAYASGGPGSGGEHGRGADGGDGGHGGDAGWIWFTYKVSSDMTQYYTDCLFGKKGLGGDGGYGGTNGSKGVMPAYANLGAAWPDVTHCMVSKNTYSECAPDRIFCLLSHDMQFYHYGSGIHNWSATDITTNDPDYTIGTFGGTTVYVQYIESTRILQAKLKYNIEEGDEEQPEESWEMLYKAKLEDTPECDDIITLIGDDDHMESDYYFDPDPASGGDCDDYYEYFHGGQRNTMTIFLNKAPSGPTLWAYIPTGSTGPPENHGLIQSASGACSTVVCPNEGADLDDMTKNGDPGSDGTNGAGSNHNPGMQLNLRFHQDQEGLKTNTPFEKTGGFDFEIVRNPIAGDDKLSLKLIGFEWFREYSVNITNMEGKVVYENTIFAKRAMNDFETPYFAKGVYNVTLQGEGNTVSRRLLVQ